MPAPGPRLARLRRWSAALRRFSVALLGSCLLACAWLPTAAASEIDLGGIELKAEVRHQLWRLQQAWQAWTKAFSANDADAAATEIEQMQLIARHLGMSRLPDLSNAAAGLAVREALAGRDQKAREALDAARQLDAGRPEIDFAEAHIARQSGRFIAAGTATLRGYVKLLSMPLERMLWLHTAILWALYTLAFSCAVFLAVLMITHGRGLIYDLSRFYSPPLGRLPADLITLGVLLWPVVLPAGLLWLALYWSVLLWSYVSRSTRAVLFLMWLIFGMMPTLLSYQQREARIALVPASRLIDNLATGRLYGAIFSDLEVLRSLLPESDTVTEIVADLHRRLGQWDYARAMYTELSQDPDRITSHTATAYCNIGVFHHRKGDYETAVNYFKRAVEADPQLAEAYFNLSQAYAQLYDFNRQHEAMAQAKALAGDVVDRWNDAAVTAQDSAIAVDGGVRRVAILRARIGELWQHGPRATGLLMIWERYRALSIAFTAFILALVIHRSRSQIGYFSRRLQSEWPKIVENRWARALIPGLPSVQRGQGVRALIGIVVPVGLLTTIMVRHSAYRPPLAIGPSGWVVILLALFFLLIVMLVRLMLELRED